MSSCCDDPRPRISERSGRVFCASCLAYLDTRRQDAPEPLRDEEADDAMNDAPDSGGDSQ